MLHAFEPQSLDKLEKQGVVCRAPEQADAEFGVRGRHTDMWGFAACVLHLATGQQPYHNLTHLQLVSAMFKRKALKCLTACQAGCSRHYSNAYCLSLLPVPLRLTCSRWADMPQLV